MVLKVVLLNETFASDSFFLSWVQVYFNLCLSL